MTGSSVLYGKPLQPIKPAPKRGISLNLLVFQKNHDGALEVAGLARLQRPQPSLCYTGPPNKSQTP